MHIDDSNLNIENDLEADSIKNKVEIEQERDSFMTSLREADCIMHKKLEVDSIMHKEETEADKHQNKIRESIGSQTNDQDNGKDTKNLGQASMKVRMKERHYQDPFLKDTITETKDQSPNLKTKDTIEEKPDQNTSQEKKHMRLIKESIKETVDLDPSQENSDQQTKDTPKEQQDQNQDLQDVFEGIKEQDTVQEIKDNLTGTQDRNLSQGTMEQKIREDQDTRKETKEQETWEETKDQDNPEETEEQETREETKDQYSREEIKDHYSQDETKYQDIQEKTKDLDTWEEETQDQYRLLNGLGLWKKMLLEAECKKTCQFPADSFSFVSPPSLLSTEDLLNNHNPGLDQDSENIAQRDSNGNLLSSEIIKTPFLGCKSMLQSKNIEIMGTDTGDKFCPDVISKLKMMEQGARDKELKQLETYLQILKDFKLNQEQMDGTEEDDDDSSGEDDLVFPGVYFAKAEAGAKLSIAQLPEDQAHITTAQIVHPEKAEKLTGFVKHNDKVTEKLMDTVNIIVKLGKDLEKDEVEHVEDRQKDTEKHVEELVNSKIEYVEDLVKKQFENAKDLVKENSIPAISTKAPAETMQETSSAFSKYGTSNIQHLRGSTSVRSVTLRGPSLQPVQVTSRLLSLRGIKSSLQDQRIPREVRPTIIHLRGVNLSPSVEEDEGGQRGQKRILAYSPGIENTEGNLALHLKLLNTNHSLFT